MNYADLFNTIFAKDHLVQELGYFFVNEPSVAEFLGKVGVEEAQVQQNIWELRFSNFDESFVLNIYFEGADGQYEPQIRIESLVLRGRTKGQGLSKKILNFLVDYCAANQPTTLWLVNVINREWKMYLISQGARLIQEEGGNNGAVLSIPGKIGLKKRRRYNDEFDRELMNYLIQFLRLEGVEVRDIRSRQSSETVYDIRVDIDGFALMFQYEKAGNAGEAQIRFELRMRQPEVQNIPVGMLVNMLNALLLYCRVHGTMTLWMFNGQVFGNDFVKYFVQRGAKVMQEFEPDLIIAMGGGSPIDAAKAMWVFYEHPETTFDDIKDPFTIPPLRNKATFIAIPSTSGTATEVTAFSVITDYSTGIKYPLADFEITPDVAIVDPSLAETMPQTLTAHTGMDALTHAIEAYVAGLHSPFSDPLAIHAIEMIFDNLKASYEGDMQARGNMHIAQCLAGMAFSNALLGIVHSLAHKTGAVFDTGHIPHGCANAIYLPYVIQYNAKVCEDRFAMIARKLGLPGVTDKALTLSLIKAVEDLRTSLHIVSNLKEFGVKEDEFLEKKHMIAERAVGDACTGSNPRETSVEDMEKILECIYYGKDVTF